MSSELTGGNLNLHWSSRLLRGLWQHGVRRTILSPGSRSTPLVLAAALHPGLDRTTVLDERSAAFQALGEANATGLPTLLVCTSGSALANYLPAVIEAEQAGIPVILLTADRPPHLRGTGSSQTIDQLHFFGSRTTFFHELGEPRGDQASLKRLDLLAGQALNRALNPGGVVHLNLPFRKPLEPDRRQMDRERETNQAQIQQDTSAGQPSPVIWTRQPVDAIPAELYESIRSAHHPLLVAGTDAPFRHLGGWVAHLQELTGLPVLAEPGAPLPDHVRTVERYAPLLREVMNSGPAPDLILRTGHTLYSRALLDFESWLENRTDIPVWHLHTRDTWQQGEARIDRRLIVPRPLRMTEEQAALLNDPEAPEDLHEGRKRWTRWWDDTNREAESALSNILARVPDLTDPAAVRAVCKALTPEDLLMVSNSMTIRDLARVRPASFPVGSIRTHRGAAGIDGILSSAIGLCRSSGARVTLLVGDLAALHDSGALLSLAGTRLPLRIVVLENGGGTIFRILPIASLDQEIFHDHFETPQPTRISALARAHGISVHSAETLDAFTSILSSPFDGPELIECITDPDSSMQLRTHI
ncbi:MAG: 2-succinyl-5-enolpyruvyl-6-hydroxy-3-cyclohexene-1-carboxylic-acid synthase [Balneolaceae bacterium]